MDNGEADEVIRLLPRKEEIYPNKTKQKKKTKFVLKGTQLKLMKETHFDTLRSR